MGIHQTDEGLSVGLPILLLVRDFRHPPNRPNKSTTVRFARVRSHKSSRYIRTGNMESRADELVRFWLANIVRLFERR